MNNNNHFNNPFNVPTPPNGSLVNYEANSSYCASDGRNYEIRVLFWRSKVVPGLQRVLITCPCGCGRTYDEYGNWSTALGDGPAADTCVYLCRNGCCPPGQQPENGARNV